MALKSTLCFWHYTVFEVLYWYLKSHRKHCVFSKGDFCVYFIPSCIQECTIQLHLPCAGQGTLDAFVYCFYLCTVIPKLRLIANGLVSWRHFPFYPEGFISSEWLAGNTGLCPVESPSGYHSMVTWCSTWPLCVSLWSPETQCEQLWTSLASDKTSAL